MTTLPWLAGLSRNRRLLLGYAAAVLLSLIAATGEAATVQTSLSPTRARVGDLLELKLRVDNADDAAIQWPTFDPDSLTFQLVSVDSQGMLPQERLFRLALYDTGKYLLPPLPIVLHTADATETLYTHHCEVEIASVLPDTASTPRAIKGLRWLPITWRDVLDWARWLVLVALAVVGVILYRRYRRKRRPEEFKPPEIVLPAHELALAELIELRDKRLPERGMLKEFFIALSEILRRYMERRYGFPALEMTTWDLEQELTGDGYAPILRDESLILLRESDLVKFAKYVPPFENCDEQLERAFRIVDATKETVQPVVRGGTA
jgi:hypothetical protein